MKTPGAALGEVRLCLERVSRHLPFESLIAVDTGAKEPEGLVNATTFLEGRRGQELAPGELEGLGTQLF